MGNNETNRVCPVEKAGGLDNSVRRFLQNPKKTVKPYIREGMTVLDIGCGPGFFTIEIAKLLNGSGKVIAADLQDGMLEIVRKKIRGTDLEQRIEIRRCASTSIGVDEKVDFILAFYVVHEVPDPVKLFQEFRSILDSDGRILVVEPKFHVNRKSFEGMLNIASGLGFEKIHRSASFLSREVLLAKREE